MTLLRRIPYILAAIILTAAMSLDAEAASQKRKTTQRRRQTTTTTTTRSADKIKKEQSTTQRKISETSKRITTTDKELKRQLNSLNSLNADIRQQDATVHRLRTHIDSLGTAITSTSDSIAILESNLDDLRTAYAKALRSLQPSAGEMDAIAFVFSAGSFSEAYSRVRYLNRFSEWRRRKAADIDQAIDRIARRRQHLTGLRHQQDKAYRQAEEARRSLSLKQNESEKLVTTLRRQGTQLKAELARQKKQAQALDRELDRIIAAEQQRIAREEAARKAKEAKNTKTTPRKTSADTNADTPSARAIASSRAETRSAAATSATQLSGSFSANKGRLLFPVSGRYKIVRQFGRQPHPTQRHVVTDNSGIDIEVPTGTSARAVFDGTVSAIFRQDGFNTIVMLRHGKYLTVYAGLSACNVRQGQHIKAGHLLGSIHSDPADDNRTILHFEVRDERQKLNPTLWVK
ncbi:MAG: peptidoglycan DD-metalloendopeptidase family protein [Duncaniella sp.]|nr:peptidoglycan DD-metalloendopeptidase family protein [Duncaniella sp.]